MKPELFVLLILFLYMPCHFFEEAKGNFPDWMYHHWTPMHLSYGHWMANNAFVFYPLLVAAFLLYYIFPEQCLVFGLAILFWGIINFCDHAFYTVKDKKVSPGLFTGVLYIIDVVFGFRSFSANYSIGIGVWILSFFVGLVLFLIPCFISAKTGKQFIKKFGAYTES